MQERLTEMISDCLEVSFEPGLPQNKKIYILKKILHASFEYCLLAIAHPKGVGCHTFKSTHLYLKYSLSSSLPPSLLILYVLYLKNLKLIIQIIALIRFDANRLNTNLTRIESGICNLKIGKDYR